MITKLLTRFLNKSYEMDTLAFKVSDPHRLKLMEKEDIDFLIKKGWWLSVSPVMINGKWAWTCGIYKRGKKTGNWITEDCKTHSTPNRAYNWARKRLEKELNI